MKRFVLGLVLIILMVFSMMFSGEKASAAVAIDIDGDAVGNVAANVATLDFLPGNTYFEGLGPVNVGGARTDVPVDVSSWSRLGSILDSDGNVILAAGLNTSFQITQVVEFSALADIAGSVISYNLADSGLASYKLYYHDALSASDLSGAGFTDGTLVYEGVITSAPGAFVKAGDIISLLDGFGANNYVGKSTYSFVGGGALTIDTIWTHDDFFVSSAPGGIVVDWNTSLIAPFSQTNPSANKFDGSSIVIGTVNGQGDNLLLQSDANTSFKNTSVVPEPATAGLSVLGLSFLALVGRRRR